MKIFRNRDFLRLWSAATVSAVGTQVSALALPLSAILLLKAGPLPVGTLLALKYLPLAVLGLPAGAIADRVRRRRLLVGCDLGRALVLGSVPAAYVFHALGIWQLYAVTLVAGTLDVFFDVAHPAYMVGLVDRDSLVEANARLQLSEQGASTLGPALASLLIGLIGAPLAVAVDSASFLGSAAVLLLIRAPEPAPETGQESRSLRADVAAGLRFVLGHESLRALTATSALANLFLRMLSAVLLVRLARDASLPPVAIGLVLSIGEAGFLAGALAAAGAKRRLGLTNTLTVAAVIVGLSGLPVALAPIRLAGPLSAAGLLVYGFAAVIWTITASSYRQTVTPAAMLGRVGAVTRVASWGVIPIASVVGGGVGARWGVQTAMIAGAVGALLAPIPVLAWRLDLGNRRQDKRREAPSESLRPGTPSC